jgi:uncharacterized protein DUF6301
VFFDIRSLIEWLTSSLWAWTTDACERLFASFGLQEAASAPGRREFSAATGLRACVYSMDGSPERIEFSFAVPDALRGHPALVDRYVDFIAAPLKPWLGEPTSVRHGEVQSWSWSLPTGTFTVAPDSTSARAVESVAFILRRPTAVRNG